MHLFVSIISLQFNFTKGIFNLKLLKVLPI